VKLRLESFTTKGVCYDVDKDTATCTCPAFDANLHCKHLEAVGVYKQHKTVLSESPNYSQALSALVKSIRIRDIEEGAYWLYYCWSFNNRLPGSQFRTVRRLLIGSAEDGHSISVMEKLSDNFPALLSKQVGFERVMAELVRICKIPTWWNPVTGGHDYIRTGMLAWRQTFYERNKYSLDPCLNSMEAAINDQNKVAAMFWVMKADESGKGAGLHIAQRLLAIAARHEHAPAQRLMRNVYLRHAKSLSDDGNFIGQAAWLLAGGISPVIDKIEPVTRGEVRRLIEQLNDTQPHPPPEWCCDGVHCAGNDIRYAGMWDRMYAVCNQFNFYGRVSPDEWIEDKVYSTEGLRVCSGQELT
jgi:hypothetical protein